LKASGLKFLTGLSFSRFDECDHVLDGNVALDGMGFEVGRGRLVGFLGPNGAGKTTTMRTVMGLLRPDAGEEVDEDELRQAVQRCTTPGETIRPPSFGSPTSTSLGRGRSVYLALGCDKCHGDDGRGNPQWLRYDAQGNPVRARDLVSEPLKGGRTPESIYLRIVAGMPGTDHPSAASLSEADLIDLVHYVASLARGPERRLTNHQRWTLATPEAYQAQAAESRPQDPR
jgi:energy-coupling factor transporter ATP-binding protein EcfA2